MLSKETLFLLDFTESWFEYFMENNSESLRELYDNCYYRILQYFLHVLHTKLMTPDIL